MDKNTMSSDDVDMLDNLMDKQLSDVEDLPEYADQIPTGTYKLRMFDVQKKSVEVEVEDEVTKTKSKQKASVIQFVYEVIECLEIADSTKTPAPAKTRFNESVFFHKDPDKALSVIKSKFAEIAAQQGWATVKDTINNIKGMEFAASVKTTKDNKKDDRFYIRVSNCVLV